MSSVNGHDNAAAYNTLLDIFEQQEAENERDQVRQKQLRLYPHLKRS